METVRAGEKLDQETPRDYPTLKAMKSLKKKIREVVRSGQHWDLPTLLRERVNPILRGWGNYFKTGNSRKHLLSIANYMASSSLIWETELLFKPTRTTPVLVGLWRNQVFDLIDRAGKVFLQ